MKNCRPSKKQQIYLLSIFLVTLFLYPTHLALHAQETNKVVAAIELEHMNVLYLFLDNPVKIAVPECQASEVEVSIDNGTISGSNGRYTIKPKEIGIATLTIKCAGKEIQKSIFRVKKSFDTRAALELDRGIFSRDKQTHFTKKEIVNAIGLKFIAYNSDFDLPWGIFSFNLVVASDDSIITSESKDPEFTDEQKLMLNRLNVGDTFFLEQIMVKMPDGVRQIPSMRFDIKEE